MNECCTTTNSHFFQFVSNIYSQTTIRTKKIQYVEHGETLVVKRNGDIIICIEH